ncbi:hypothetical protein [Leptospira koniambonensis]|uniref:hypothetical protein n=1 Tax=Leptospira koniambonensis TaxID=2484950 RepID=UPI003EBFB0DB
MLVIEIHQKIGNELILSASSAYFRKTNKSDFVNLELKSWGSKIRTKNQHAVISFDISKDSKDNIFKFAAKFYHSGELDEWDGDLIAKSVEFSIIEIQNKQEHILKKYDFKKIVCLPPEL